MQQHVDGQERTILISGCSSGIGRCAAEGLRARGWRALSHDDPGYAEARGRDLQTIPADVVLRTRNSTLYHCICRYRVGSATYYDDPSARLGMFGGKTMTSAEVQSYLGRFSDA